MKFEVNQLVKHKDGNLYRILEIPTKHNRLEYCDEPYYKYVSISDDVTWIRSASEMEDGRFTSNSTMFNAPMYSVSKLEGKKCVGFNHGTDTVNDTLCGIQITNGDWIILNNDYTGIFTCPSCLKLIGGN